MSPSNMGYTQERAEVYNVRVDTSYVARAINNDIADWMVRDINMI